MVTQEQLREQITAQVIAGLRIRERPALATTVATRRERGAPCNVVSKHGYRGLNLLLLDVAATRHNLSSRWWGTFNQWRQLGGKVISSQPMSPRASGEPKSSSGLPLLRSSKTRTASKEDRFFFMRTYTVFNVDQVEGLDHLRAAQSDTGETALIDYQPAEGAVEASLLGMGLSLRYGGGKAFYSPAQDYIKSPRNQL